MGSICFSPAGDLAVQLPLTHQEHSAGMGSPHVVHLWSSRCFCGVVPDMEAQQMGDAQPYSGTNGQRIRMRPHHQYDQDHGLASIPAAGSDCISILHILRIATQSSLPVMHMAPLYQHGAHCVKSYDKIPSAPPQNLTGLHVYDHSVACV